MSFNIPLTTRWYFHEKLQNTLVLFNVASLLMNGTINGWYENGWYARCKPCELITYSCLICVNQGAVTNYWTR